MFISHRFTLRNLCLSIVVLTIVVLLISNVFFLFYVSSFNNLRDDFISTQRKNMGNSTIFENRCSNNTNDYSELLKPYGFDPKSHRSDDKYVLVLGSNGLIGSVLTNRLKKRKYKVLEVFSRHHRDLRLEHSLNIFDHVNISFVFFLDYRQKPRHCLKKHLPDR